ncbi:hypothetical protein DNK01_09965, partial [Stutzerimonas kirkiae]
MAEVLMPLMPFSASRLSRALCTSITARGSLTGAGVSRAMRPIRESVPIGWSGVTLEGGAASIWAAEMLLGSARGARAQANGLLSTREARHGDWRERFTEPEAIAEDATPVERMKHRLKTKVGRAAY